MSLLNSQNHQKHHHSPKHKKKSLNQDQIRLLEASFDGNKKLEPERKLQLARELGVPPRQIAIWYQNKRARWKNQRLELDYNALQARLESTLAEKKQLEKEVKHLQEELHKARDVLIAAHTQAAAAVAVPAYHPPVTSLSSCCDDGGSASLYDDVSCSWDINGEDLQLDELYPACFLGGGGDGSTCGASRWQNDGGNVVFGISTRKS